MARPAARRVQAPLRCGGRARHSEELPCWITRPWATGRFRSFVEAPTIRAQGDGSSRASAIWRSPRASSASRRQRRAPLASHLQMSQLDRHGLCLEMRGRKAQPRWAIRSPRRQAATRSHLLALVALQRRQRVAYLAKLPRLALLGLRLVALALRAASSLRREGEIPFKLEPAPAAIHPSRQQVWFPLPSEYSQPLQQRRQNSGSAPVGLQVQRQAGIPLGPALPDPWRLLLVPGWARLASPGRAPSAASARLLVRHLGIHLAPILHRRFARRLPSARRASRARRSGELVGQTLLESRQAAPLLFPMRPGHLREQDGPRPCLVRHGVLQRTDVVRVRAEAFST